MRYILMGVLGVLLILASALGDSTISSLRPKDGSTPSILKVQGENNRSPTYQLRLDGVYQQVERPIGAFNFNESLWTGLKYPIFDFSKFQAVPNLDQPLDKGIGCPSFPSFLYQYNPPLVHKRQDKDPNRFLLHYALRNQVKQVIIWTYTEYRSEDPHCGKATLAGTAFAYKLDYTHKFILWITVHHVGRPEYYLDPLHNLARITVEDQEAIVLFDDGKNVLLLTPFLNDYFSTTLKVMATPEPGTSTFAEMFSITKPTKLWSLGRTIVPVCGPKCIGARGWLHRKFQEIGTLTECVIMNDQSSTVHGENWLGADIWGTCLPIAGNSGGPAVIETEDGLRIVGVLNVGGGGNSGHFAITEEFLAEAERYYQLLTAGWDPFEERDEEESKEELKPPATREPHRDSEGKGVDKMSYFKNWATLDKEARQLWEKAYPANEDYQITRDLTFETESIHFEVALDEAFLDDFFEIALEGKLHDLAQYIPRWTLVKIEKREN